MAENEHQNGIDQDNNLEEILEVGPNCCIYKVPQYLRKKNEAAYTPYFISIGPFHYDRKEFMEMERQKRRYLSEFGNRLTDALELDKFENYITSQEQCIRGYYSMTNALPSSEYVQIILCDAVFIIELFMRLAAVGQIQPIVGQVQPMVQSSGGIRDLPCATKLQKSGLQFKAIDHQFLHEISWGEGRLGKCLPWFGGDEVRIPRIIISDEIETYFRNLIALEIFHYPTQTYICHYADLMDHLIDTDKDVDLLIEKGIIVNKVGDIDAIVRMFNGLNSQIAIGNSPHYAIVEKMKAHYRFPCNHLMATLKSGYFSNFWTGTATIAAAVLLILTLIQTIYAVKK